MMSCGCHWKNPYTPYRPFLSKQDVTYEDYFPEKGEVCIPMPTEEFGFASRICAKIERDDGLYASIFIVVDEVLKIQLGSVSYSDSYLKVDIGLIITGPLDLGTGLGGTLEVDVDTQSGVISACANLDYEFGSVAPWYGIITTFGDVIPAPS